MYRYFLQPQLDASNNSLIGYELLIRQKNDDKWTLPENFEAIPIAVQTDLIQRTAQKLLLKIGSVSFNTNRTQFIDPDIAAAILAAQQSIYPIKLVVEVTEESTDAAITEQQLLDQIHFFEQHGIELSLDDIGTGVNTYEHIKAFLPLASEIKFAMQNFRKEGRSEQTPEQLAFWQTIAEKHHLRLILEGVENQAEHDLANDIGVDFRQGWFYGRPHLFKLGGE